MSSADIYCAACGAANATNETACFACGRDLSEAEPAEELLHGRYRMLAVVGQGGFARVYRAEDTLESRVVAIKAIHLKSLSAQEAIDATDTYNREIRFGALLSHPALPKLYDSFTDQDTWYIVAEFINGQTLEEYTHRLPSRCVPLDEVIALGIELCEALAYLHSRQPAVIFRDIKPDNIMRTPAGRIYLIDFGIARQLRPRSKRDTQTLGSPGYAAPEQYGKAQTTEQSDIYSLGATLRALLTGKNPLDAQDDDLRRSQTLPVELENLLTQMLAHEPSQRPASAHAVKEKLKSIAVAQDMQRRRTLQSLPAHRARPAPVYRRAAKKKSGSAWLRTLLVATILCTLGGLLNTTGFLSAMQQTLVSVGTTLTTLTPRIQNVPVLAAQQTLALGVSDGTGDVQLDPTQVIDSQATQVEVAIYSGLFQLDSTTQVEPQLVSSWQRSRDGRTWTFHLRPKLKFSDGSALTSQDVAFSLDRALDPTLNSPTATSYLGYLQGATQRINGSAATLIGSSILAPDATTVVLKTADSIAFLPTLLTAPCALVLEKSLVSRYGNKFVEHLSSGGASGPFKFAQRISANTVDLVPNPYYYGLKPRLTRLSFSFFEDAIDSYEAYIDGKTAVAEVPSSKVNEVSNAVDFHAAPQLWITYYAMNYLVKPFDNIKIRQAFALALNKVLIADVAYKRLVTPTNHIVPEQEYGSNPQLVGPNAENSLYGSGVSARQLLQEGLQEEGLSNSNQLPPITFSFQNTPSATEEAAMAQEQWQSSLGIKIRLQPLSTIELLKRAQASAHNPHGLQLWRASWAADYPDPQDWTSLQFAQNSPNNTVNYAQNNGSTAGKQREVQQMLQEADQQADPATRIRLYQYAEQSLVNDVAWLPLYQQQENYLLKLGVNGYMINEMGTMAADDWAKVYITR